MTAVQWIGLAVTAAGAGLSYSAQTSAANSAEQMGLINAAAGAQQATQSAQISGLQATLQATQAQTAKESAFANAEALRMQAEADAKVAQENVRRNRDQFARELAAATAAQGGSGATLATGSPLDFLVNAADVEAQEEATAGYTTNAARQGAFRQAAAVELGGRVEGLNASLYQLESLSAIQEGRMGAAQARLGGMAAQSQAAGARASAFGGLLGAGAGLATQYSNFAAQNAAAAAYKKKRY